MTAPSDVDLGRAVLALDELIRTGHYEQFTEQVRAHAPLVLLDQFDAATAHTDRGLQQVAAMTGSTSGYSTFGDHSGWVTLGLLHAIVAWQAGQGSTCLHSPDPRRPRPVTAAAWRPGLVTCARCTHLLACRPSSAADCHLRRLRTGHHRPRARRRHPPDRPRGRPLHLPARRLHWLLLVDAVTRVPPDLDPSHQRHEETTMTTPTIPARGPHLDAALEVAIDGAELDALDRYDDAISGMLDSLDPDVLDDAALDELRDLGPTLTEWWQALDTLDGDLRGEAVSRDARLALNARMLDWFDVRTHYLLALARAAGVTVPHPDHDSGAVATSSGHRGAVGYHDPDLDARLAEWDQAERDHGPDAS